MAHIEYALKREGTSFFAKRSEGPGLLVTGVLVAFILPTLFSQGLPLPEVRVSPLIVSYAHIQVYSSCQPHCIYVFRAHKNVSGSRSSSRKEENGDTSRPSQMICCRRFDVWRGRVCGYRSASLGTRDPSQEIRWSSSTHRNIASPLKEYSGP